MKKILAITIFLCFISVISFAQSKDERQVAAAVEKLKTGMLDANKQILEDITAPELSYGHSSGKIEDKAAFIQALVSGVSDFITMDITAQSIKVVGKTALVRHNLSGNTKDSGVPNTIKLGILLVWQKQHGQWKLLGRQAYKLP